jgi:hypothetical protein
VLQELLWRQIARLPPIEDRLGDIQRNIAEADEAREVGPTDTLSLGECGGVFALVSTALNRCAVRSSFTNRASGFAVANGSVLSITILISRPATAQPYRYGYKLSFLLPHPLRWRGIALSG